MRLPIERKNVTVYPDPKRVIARFFFYGEERAKNLIQRVMSIEEKNVIETITPLLQEYSKRHRNITRVLNRHCNRLSHLFPLLGLNFESLSMHRKLLLGSYFTHEYSIESAAFFNPSIVEDPDQSELELGEKRMIISFRAVGEGHISSIVFRRVLIDKNCNIHVMPASHYIDEAETVKNIIYNRKAFFDCIDSTSLDKETLLVIEQNLAEQFEYKEIKKLILTLQQQTTSEPKKLEFEKVLWEADEYLDIEFSLDTDISDRVIFPISEFERQGIEDARFVRFTEENGEVVYYATYTAYDGAMIMPKLLRTSDFYKFTFMPLYGKGAQNKNLALFPRKINGKYAMISRIDGWSNYIMFADDINVWENPIRIQEPKYPWELIQIGNCGSPIETEKGWLVITHGVGPMRRYCLGASLLKLEDPSVEIGRLSEPILIPNKDEREGYVPNVLYSCGSLAHNNHLIIPYGLSDHGSSFATVELNALLEKLLEKDSAV